MESNYENMTNEGKIVHNTEITRKCVVFFTALIAIGLGISLIFGIMATGIMKNL